MLLCALMPESGETQSTTYLAFISLHTNISHFQWGRVIVNGYFQNGALRAFNFLLDGDVKLNLPDFITHKRDTLNVIINDESDEELNL